MATNYPDQLGNWVQEHPESQHECNMAAFLVVRKDVRAALNAGYRMKLIWKNLRASKRICFGYDAFRRYVHRFIENTSPADQQIAPDATTATQSGQRPSGTSGTLPTNLPGFVLNTNPKKEDLF